MVNISEDLEQLVEETLATIPIVEEAIKAVTLNTEEAVALKYIYGLHLHYAPFSELGVRARPVHMVLTELEQQNPADFLRRYWKAKAILPEMAEDYFVELRLVVETDFRTRMFSLYENKFLPQLRQSIN